MHRLVYGTNVPLIGHRNEEYVAALLSVAGAEGVVSPNEQAWLRDRCTVLQLEPKRFASFFDAIGSDGTVQRSALVDTDGTAELGSGAVALAVLFDAVTMASQEGGFTDAKIERSQRVAARFGLDRKLCTEVLDVVREEIRLQASKRTLFGCRSPRSSKGDTVKV